MQLSLPLIAPDLAAPHPSNPADPAPEPRIYARNTRARRYVIRMLSDGVLRITIPRGGSRKEAAAFADRQRAWIARQRARLVPPRWSIEDRRTLVQRARVELPGRLLALASVHRLPVTRVSVRNQRTRWGSCAPGGHISLNWRLVVMPDWVCDYVLIHELMHLRRLDHSPEYWRLVADACPEYQRAREWLRTHGPSLR